MITIEFSEDDKAALNYERRHHPHPFVQRKMEALWLKSQALAHKDIRQLTNVCSTTLTSYIRDYQQGGIEALKALSFRRPANDLDDHRHSLEAYFRAHPPAGAKQAMATIETLTRVKRSPERVRAFLKRMGMKCRKAGMIPAKADPLVQDTFKKTRLNLGLKRQRPAGALFSSLTPHISF